MIWLLLVGLGFGVFVEVMHGRSGRRGPREGRAEL